AEVAFGEEEDVNRAVESAWKANLSGTWSKMPPTERCRRLRKISEIIEAHADELAELETQDNGKPLTVAKGDILAAAATFEYFSQLPEQVCGKIYPDNPGYFTYSRREPYGVV
ncbi:MAG TPA: aldehyde dehydrogenase family protein, partial [Nitrospina sp.]|nr:aldehyde dehydrogenase family protein [Nitrospina sp.]